MKRIHDWLALAVLGLGSLVDPVQAQDTVRVRADGPPLWGRNVRLAQELVVGQADGPLEYAFGRIFQAAPEPGGAFYLFDANDRQIRRYDARGRFTGRIGRRGGGPGEYQSVGGMAVDARGRLLVFDPSARRISHFGPDGKLLDETSINRGAFNDFVIDSAGRMYFIVTAGGRMMEGPGAQQQYLRLSPEGRVLDSLPFPRLTAGTAPRRGFALSTSDGMRMNFIDQNHVAPYLAGGLLAAGSHAYRVIVSDGARRAMVIERSQRPVSLGGEERAQWLEWADSMRLRGGGPYEIPRTKPFIRRLRSDHLGRIWVEVYVEAEKRLKLPKTRPGGGKQILHWRERTTYDVFSPTGVYMGRVALPAETVLLAVRGNRIYTRGRGPDDEERVVVYRLEVPDRP
jgi:hypothetical protein